MGKPGNTRKYPTYPEIPESKKDTWKYLIIYFNNPAYPNRIWPATPYFVQNPTWPGPILKNITCWALLVWRPKNVNFELRGLKNGFFDWVQV